MPTLQKPIQASKAAGQVSNQRLCLRPPDVPSTRAASAGLSDPSRPALPFKKGGAGPSKEDYVRSSPARKRRFCGENNLVRCMKLRCRSESA
jgi:hypothetical protein